MVLLSVSSVANADWTAEKPAIGVDSTGELIFKDGNNVSSSLSQLLIRLAQTETIARGLVDQLSTQTAVSSQQVQFLNDQLSTQRATIANLSQLLNDQKTTSDNNFARLQRHFNAQSYRVGTATPWYTTLPTISLRVFNTNTAIHDVIFADLTGDGLLDIVVGGISNVNNTASTITWLRNEGKNTFTEMSTLSVPTIGLYYLVAADLNNDNKTDLLTVTYFGGVTSWFRNNGNNSFTYLPFSQILSSSSAVAAGDLDGDGFKDVVVGSWISVSRWFKNNRNSTFTLMSSFTGVNCTSDIALADLNADGRLDIITSDYDGARILVHMNNGSNNISAVGPNFITSVVGSQPRAAAVCAADFDRDGNIDLATCTEDGPLTWFRNQFANSSLNQSVAPVFTPFTISPKIPSIVGVECMDLDLDGDVDVAYSTSSGHASGWFRNELITDSRSGVQAGMVRFTEMPLYSSSSRVFHAPPVGDLDGDGDLDVVVVNYPSYTLTVLQNEIVVDL